MTKRSGFNISIDKPLNPLTPKYVASYKNDPIRNSLIKLSNKPKYSHFNNMNDPEQKNLVKKEEEAKYFQK